MPCRSMCFLKSLSHLPSSWTLKHFSYNYLHPSSKSVKLKCFTNDLCLSLFKRLPGSAHVLANCWLLRLFSIAFQDLLDSPPRDFHIQRNLFCRHSFLILPDNPMDLALVQFHNPCYGSMAKACAKYFQDSTQNNDSRKCINT